MEAERREEATLLAIDSHSCVSPLEPCRAVPSRATIYERTRTRKERDVYYYNPRSVYYRMLLTDRFFFFSSAVTFSFSFYFFPLQETTKWELSLTAEAAEAQDDTHTHTPSFSPSIVYFIDFL